MEIHCFYTLDLGRGEEGIITTTYDERLWMDRNKFERDHTGAIGTGVFPFTSSEAMHRRLDLKGALKQAGFIDQGPFDNNAMRELTKGEEGK